MKDAVIKRVLELKKEHGVEIGNDILELDYVKTCGDYSSHIQSSLDGHGRTAFYTKLKEPGLTMIPSKIEDVPTPDLFEEILRKLDLWNAYMETRVDDYRYYHENKTHRSPERWNNRAEWKHPESKDE